MDAKEQVQWIAQLFAERCGDSICQKDKVTLSLPDESTLELTFKPLSERSVASLLSNAERAGNWFLSVEAKASLKSISDILLGSNKKLWIYKGHVVDKIGNVIAFKEGTPPPTCCEHILSLVGDITSAVQSQCSPIKLAQETRYGICGSAQYPRGDKDVIETMNAVYPFDGGGVATRERLVLSYDPCWGIKRFYDTGRNDQAHIIYALCAGLLASGRRDVASQILAQRTKLRGAQSQDHEETLTRLGAALR